MFTGWVRFRVPILTVKKQKGINFDGNEILQPQLTGGGMHTIFVKEIRKGTKVLIFFALHEDKWNEICNQ